MLILIYIKAYPDNIFEFKQAYNKVIIIIITLFIESISLQKSLGPKFFIPKLLKGKQYDYYRNLNDVNENDLESIWAICLVKIRDDPTKESDIKLELVSDNIINNIDILFYMFFLFFFSLIFFFIFNLIYLIIISILFFYK